MDNKLLSVDELADYLGVPSNTVYQWRKTGKGPRGYRIGKYVRFRPDEVDSWIDGQVTA
ncbi:MAG TPA: helix-turn-helix domain-containing protein [Amycolatopsis sp.]|uniref:helix-turn-helix transcriptional regulator n=1 Tax=unclassified Amycolatopsis TaxID=2618356 RepID=UPI00106E2CCB|nr:MULTISPECIES: helix-turn-helix domain-containing protein [unclassified Amycolatopsis]HWD05130.1 helix-turn-helix domain-containing protein [Amycolatopsis sp.]